MVKNRERVRFCFVVFCFIAAPDAAKTGLERAAIHCCRTRHAARRVEGYNCRTYHAARRDGFQARYGFKQDYYAVESHYVPTIASRLDLPDPSRRAARRVSGKIRLQARLLRSEISFRPAGPSARLCGG